MTTRLAFEYNAENDRVMLVELDSGSLALEISPDVIGRPESQPMVEEMLRHRYPEGYELPDEFGVLFEAPQDSYLAAIEMFAMARHEAEKRRRGEGGHGH